MKRAREFEGLNMVEERLTAMRMRLPARTKDTHLEGLIAELEGLLSLHADEPACEGLRCHNCRHGGLRSGCGGLRKTVVCGVEEKVGLLRNECLRVHGRDVWEVAEVKSAIDGMLVQYYQRIVQHNLAVCFDALEAHVENALKLRYEKGFIIGEPAGWVSVVEFEKKWGRMGRHLGYNNHGYHYHSVDFQLPEYRRDGIEWGVQIVTLHTTPSYVDEPSYDREKFFALDAGAAELEGHTPQIKMLGFVEYVNTALLHWPRVHRAESLYDAVFDVFEENIRRLATAMENIDLQEVLSRLF